MDRGRVMHIGIVKHAIAAKLSNVVSREQLAQLENVSSDWKGLLLECDAETILGTGVFLVLTSVLSEGIPLYRLAADSVMARIKKEDPNIFERMEKEAQHFAIKSVERIVDLDNCTPPCMCMGIGIKTDKGLRMLKATDKMEEEDAQPQHFFSIEDIERIAAEYANLYIFEEEALKRARELAKECCGFLPVYDVALIFGSEVTNFLLADRKARKVAPEKEALKKIKAAAKEVPIKVFVMDSEKRNKFFKEGTSPIIALIGAGLGLAEPPVTQKDEVSYSLILAKEEKK